MGVHVGSSGGPRSGSDGDELRPVLRHGRGQLRAAAQHAKAKHTAKSIEAGRYDLVLDPSHLWLTIHESVGHPLELDRVLGYEANYAGTSFATLDKWKTGSFKYGSEHVNLVADKTQPVYSAPWGTTTKGSRPRSGIWSARAFSPTTRRSDQVHILGRVNRMAVYADSWSSVQFQRMPNVSLEPGEALMTPAQMIARTGHLHRGRLVLLDRPAAVQLPVQRAGVLRNSRRKITGMLRDVAYQSNTHAPGTHGCVCDRRDYRLGGSFFDGKGQPPQISAVSHGSRHGAVQ